MPTTPVRLIALSAATGGLFGYMIAVSNDAIASVRTELQLTPWTAALVVSALVAGALLGCVSPEPPRTASAGVTRSSPRPSSRSSASPSPPRPGSRSS